MLLGVLWVHRPWQKKKKKEELAYLTSQNRTQEGKLIEATIFKMTIKQEDMMTRDSILGVIFQWIAIGFGQIKREQ